MADVKVRVKTESTGQGDIPKLSSQWKQFTGTVETASKFLGAAAAGAALAWKTLGQGAELELARSRFENLAASIGTTADALENQLGQASRNMTTNAEDIASASQIISLGLADNQQDVVDLATLVSQLGWDMNQVILTFANNSKMRLDALGLSVTDVEDRMAALEAQGYDTDKAFDLAVIQAGQAKLELLGGAADTGAGGMERLKNRTIDAMNALLGYIAVRAEPALTGAADAFDELEAAMNDMNRALELGLITQEMYDWATDKTTGGILTHKQLVRETRIALSELVDTSESADRAMLQQAASYKAAADAAYEAQVADAFFNISLKDSVTAYAKAKAAADEYTAQMEDQRAALITTREEQERLTALTGDYFTTAVNDGADALVSYNRTVTTTGGLTADQRANLDELTGAYERTQANIRSLTGGTAGLGLTQDELNKKLEEQYNQLGLLQGPMESLQQITSEVTGVNESYTYNQDAINRALYEAADAAGVDANSLAMLGIATGQLSEEQAVAALKAAALQGKIEELGLAIKNGMDPQTAINNLQTFQTHLDAQDFRVRIGLDAEPVEKDSGKIKQAIQPTIDETKTAVNDLGLEFVAMQETATGQFEALNSTLMTSKTGYLDPVYETVSNIKNDLWGLPEEKTIRIKIITEGTIPNLPSGSTTGGGGNAPAGSYATGGVVPGPIGRPQLAVVHGGEEVLTPEQRRGRGNITISFAGAIFQGTTAETAGKIAETVAAKIGRL